MQQSVFTRIRGRFFHSYFLIKRPMTLGVRAMVINEADNSIFLVRHTYVPGWHMPGGGVERGQTLRQALAMELTEEANIELTGEPELYAVYFNARSSVRDHVALFICRAWTQSEPRSADKEIAEAGFFPLAALPEGTTEATKRRIAEVFSGVGAEELW
jgi:ADP-ribose pyrophosphatase YjhB (NUDIX family)